MCSQRRPVATPDDDWIAQLMRDYQDEITRAAYDGIYRLDDRALDTVMERQAHGCVQAFVRLYDIPADLSLEDFLERMTQGDGPSQISVQRSGNLIRWEEHHGGECMCPLVRRNVIPLRLELCNCAIHWLRMLIERHAKGPAQVALLDSVARGGQNCVFLITLGDGTVGHGS